MCEWSPITDQYIILKQVKSLHTDVAILNAHFFVLYIKIISEIQNPKYLFLQ